MFKCTKCKKDLSVLDEYCSSCGYKMVEKVVKGRGEASLDWVKNIFINKGYSVKEFNINLVLYNEDEDAVASIFIVENVDFIFFSKVFFLEDKKEENMTLLLVDIDKANRSSYLTRFLLNDEDEDECRSLRARASMNICENVSNRDILEYFDLFEEDIKFGLDKSGLVKRIKKSLST